MKRMSMRTASGLTAGTAAVLVMISVHAGAQAQNGRAAALVDQRQARMKILGASMKTLVDFSKGESNAAAAKAAAAAIAANANRMHRWWPAGTAHGVGDSKASPSLWTDRATLDARIAQLRQAAAAMNLAAATGDPARVGAQIPAVGGACKACHTPFQLKD